MQDKSTRNVFHISGNGSLIAQVLTQDNWAKQEFVCDLSG